MIKKLLLLGAVLQGTITVALVTSFPFDNLALRLHGKSKVIHPIPPLNKECHSGSLDVWPLVRVRRRVALRHPISCPHVRSERRCDRVRGCPQWSRALSN